MLCIYVGYEQWEKDRNIKRSGFKDIIFTYILKTRVLVVQTPQTICNFPQKDCLKRENYQSHSLKANNSVMCYK